MIVWDVVMVVSPGARTSVPVGRWWIESWDLEADAIRRAEDCNECRGDVHAGYHCLVERHDEECTGRAPIPGEGKRPGACTCRASRDATGAIETDSADPETDPRRRAF